jgi:protein-S-isoprenylcysteine O-methyltransferase Ste14
MMDVNEAIRWTWMAAGAVWAEGWWITKRTARSEAMESRTGHVVTLAVAFGLLFSPWLRQGPLGWRVIPYSEAAGVFALALTIAGVGVAIWARFCLGRNWSAIVELKQGHTLVRQGPYRLVRHPIYAGFLAAMLGSAIGCGELGALLGVAVGFAGWLAKARLEESFLLAQFPEAYGEYRQRVRALIPFVL